MAFSYQTKLLIHDNAGGQCECLRVSCFHSGRCTARYTPTLNPLYGKFTYAEQYIFPGFEFNHRQSQVSGGSDTPENGEFLCVSCHRNTKSFGVNLTR